MHRQNNTLTDNIESQFNPNFVIDPFLNILYLSQMITLYQKELTEHKSMYISNERTKASSHLIYWADKGRNNLSKCRLNHWKIEIPMQLVLKIIDEDKSQALCLHYFSGLWSILVDNFRVLSIAKPTNSCVWVWEDMGVIILINVGMFCRDAFP